MDYIAHARQEGESWNLHALDAHLAGVSAVAACFARDIGEDWARLAGLWHDLGKYSPAFQSMIRRESGYDENAHIESGPRNHSTAGAIYAMNRLGPPGRILAYLIAGHHAGLPDWRGDQNAGAALTTRLAQTEHLDVLPLAEIPADILSPPTPAIPKIPGSRDGAHLWLRILFRAWWMPTFWTPKLSWRPRSPQRVLRNLQSRPCWNVSIVTWSNLPTNRRPPSIVFVPTY